MQIRGMVAKPYCVIPYADAGKACTGKSDCEGRCIAQPAEGGMPEMGTKVTGMCQRDNALFGCFAEVEGGVARGGLCID